MKTRLMTGDVKAKCKSRQMVRIMKDPLFWHSLTWLATYIMSFLALLIRFTIAA